MPSSHDQFHCQSDLQRIYVTPKRVAPTTKAGTGPLQQKYYAHKQTTFLNQDYRSTSGELRCAYKLQAFHLFATLVFDGL